MGLKVLAIVGPTASGKSALAIRIAQTVASEIVSCDSVQVYKYFDIGTGKVDALGRSVCRHHLLDVLDPTESSDVGWWRDSAVQIVSAIHARGSLPIIVGGTPLYLQSLYRGMFQMASCDYTIRRYLEARIYNESVEVLFEELLQKDPEYASHISSQDTMRIVRALEAISVTGVKFSDLHKRNVHPDWDWMVVLLGRDREILKQKIDLRVDNMLKEGLCEETVSLLKHFDRSCKPFTSVGYRHALNYIDNVWSYDEMRTHLITDTQKLAKRQMTFFRSILKDTFTYNEDNIINEVKLWIT